MNSTNFSVDFLLSIQPIVPNNQNLHPIRTAMMQPSQNYLAQFYQFPSNQQFFQQLQQQFMQSNINNLILNKTLANLMWIPSMLLNTQINQFAKNVSLHSMENGMTNLAKVEPKYVRPTPIPILNYEWLKRKNCGRNRKSKKRRAFSVEQTKCLEKHFKAQRYISIEQRAQISEFLGLSQQQVKIWFQNRRYKMKTGQKPIDGTTNGNKLENGTKWNLE